MTRWPRWLLAVLVVVLAAIPGVVVALVMTAGGAPAPFTRADPPQQRQAQPLPHPEPLVDGGASMADVVERAGPSVVSILSTAAAPGRLAPLLRQGPGHGGPDVHGQGAGVILSEDGLVLTSSHVVSGADTIRVTLADERTANGEVVGADPRSDLALLRLEGPPEGLVPMPFGDSNRLRPADVVLAIGNPFGIGQAVTMGIVSALGRADLGIVDYEDFIQTDAAVNPGSSGGPLVDMEGQLVGINTAILSRTGAHQGIAFAVPSNLARRVVDSLLEHGRVIRGWMGVAIQDLSEDLAEALGTEATQGVVVVQTVPDGPADEAGLERGDVILRIDGRPVESSGQLRNEIAMKGADGEVTLQVARGDERRQVRVALEELPGDPVEELEGPAGNHGFQGLSLVPLDDEARSRFDLPERVTRGVVVEEVAPGSPSARAGLRPGDVLVELNRNRVTSVGQAIRLFERAQGKVLLRVERERTTFFAVIPR